MLPEIPRNKVTKANGTTSQTIQTSDNIRIRVEQHPLLPSETYNPRHHGVHYHVEYKVDPAKSWNNNNKEFGANGWKQLPDAVSKRYLFIPAKVEVEEHHIGVYASKKEDWVHCRRKFDEALKTIPKSGQKDSESYLLMKQIQAIYREEGKLDDLASDQRLEQRQLVVKPLVDAFFAYLKKLNISAKDKFGEAVGYALNQERYLRVFLENGDVPIDNNASERAIRVFCIGKKNWQMIDTINGAKTSAIIYSIVETAKSNNLKPYDYIQYILEEIPKHMDDTDRSFIQNLLPWSENLPAEIRKQ